MKNFSRRPVGRLANEEERGGRQAFPGWRRTRPHMRALVAVPTRALGLLLLFLALGAAAASGQTRHAVLCDFESGSASLTSYDGEDQSPSSWSVQSGNTYGGSDYALRIYGNSWKELAIAPHAIMQETVLQAALYIAERGEMQAIGFGDGSGNILFYCVAGTQLNLSDRWNVVYQSFYPIEEWHAYHFPLGEDWNDTWGYLPQITQIVFVNDRDNTQNGETFYDEIYDVTDEISIAPRVEIQKIPGACKVTSLGKDLYRLDMQFQALVFDPDSETHTYAWDFGDGASSTLANPSHSFTATADYTFTVSLDVTDDSGLFGRDTCQVAVEPSPGSGEISINFTGDVFLGRGYEQRGGLIETYGVEYLFTPTLDILGNAADVTMVNAECAFTNRGTPHPSKSVVFRTSPGNIDGLVYAGVDVASTGNNHIIDYGCEGLEQTLEVFEQAGIVAGGSGANAYFALQPSYYTRDGIRLAFIDFCNRTGRADNEQPFYDAGYDKCGLGYWIEPNIERAIAQADSLADVVIAFPHSGIEYDSAPESRGDGMPTESIDVELCPPFVDPEDAPEVQFRIWPGLSDRELRYRAVDLGAAAVLNAHPHVLQGFEVYQGVLIAHSLGNFMFDLYYPETMPTMVLRARIDKEGVIGWTFKPAYIDQWIPRPASGRLGREILDRMADYSRVMNTWVGVDPEVMTGTIFLDPAEAHQLVSAQEGTQSLARNGDYYISRPIALAGEGSLSRITGIAGLGDDCEVRWGREVLWFGGFEEAEGHHMWDVNSSDEWLDDEVFHEGSHSLALRRAGSGTNVTTQLTRNLPAADSLEYSLTGWMKTSVAQGAKFTQRFFSSRYSTMPLSSVDMGAEVDGTTNWTWYSCDITPPEHTTFFNVRCNLSGSQSGTGMAWFDDLRVIEWEPWQPAELPMQVPFPNNYRFVQVRTGNAVYTTTVSYEETALTDGGASDLPFEPAPRVDVLIQAPSPNPFRGGTAIKFRLSANARVDLDIYDVSGRLVEQLARDEAMKPGWHRVAWRAERQATGVYFARLTVNGESATQKLILVR
ncbi:MAG: CapA family protein [Candidatus Eisenbacteria bacterium]|nr:CapA family protein [Candidatus Eisenbacteria bacterium]